tara:strand:- start:372 stop:608 length:237 start_codon:yes stop_codon:yes gene_type:complete
MFKFIRFIATSCFSSIKFVISIIFSDNSSRLVEEASIFMEFVDIENLISILASRLSFNIEIMSLFSSGESRLQNEGAR